MILTGILRHYATVLMATTPKKQELPAIREQRSLLRGINLRNNAHVLTPAAFQPRKDYLVQAFEEGKFLKEPEKKGQAAPNPMTDPAAMEGMMGMMKGNMSMMIPQTLIMGWINAFFSGFVIIKLPFPLTIKFKTASQMAQQMGQMGPGAGAQMFGPGVDPDKQFQGEAENLSVLAHKSTLEGVEERLLESVRV
ncbi:hypothetical protein SS1G_07740 [Sclerotinia sclerotiorum 1980 UF-70]|uniref:ER membrane protein complex subunit 3 n=1 Tax=Sclerotinia sclerotiorum (strain ATCC 18683 / 1980 / Ss-1) TaxID=665079 RepID=A7EQY7_SCLS1|nr:hypothetical protein SS1G_07740 [Sclerotinia sclerotiorum 1980 UF-70]EDN91879.1 hypothetical protein SS1G_07740 [Sclerotinia sclerotiorum 1980 UF-70]